MLLRACIASEVFEVGSALIKVHSFNTPCRVRLSWTKSHSPTTSRISVATDARLHIFDQNSNRLLEETGSFISHSFSSDGSLFAASAWGVVRIWKYDSGRYVPWKKFRRQTRLDLPLQFSTTPYSIVDSDDLVLQVRRIYDLPAAPDPPCEQLVCLSPSGNYAATAHKFGSTVTIIGLCSGNLQFVDAGAEITGLALNGHVILVVASENVVAWSLTEVGLVDGVLDSRRAGRCDSILDISQQLLPLIWDLTGGGKSRAGLLSRAWPDLNAPGLTDNAETRDVLPSIQAPQPYPSNRGGSATLRAELKEGWVVDQEGRSRLWVPVEWRMSWDGDDWLDLTTMFSTIGGQPFVIKF